MYKFILHLEHKNVFLHMILSFLLGKYLYCNNRVALNGLGSFEKLHQICERNSEKNELHLYFNKIKFIQDSDISDDDFIYFVSNEKGVSFEDSKKFISNEIAEWNIILGNEKFIQIHSLGNLKIEGKEIRFLNEEIQNPFAFGLSKTYLLK